MSSLEVQLKKTKLFNKIESYIEVKESKDVSVSEAREMIEEMMSTAPFIEKQRKEAELNAKFYEIREQNYFKILQVLRSIEVCDSNEENSGKEKMDNNNDEWEETEFLNEDEKEKPHEMNVENSVKEEMSDED